MPTKNFSKTKLISIILSFLSLVLLTYISIVLISQTYNVNKQKDGIFISNIASYIPQINKFVFLGDTGSGEKPQYEVADGINKYCNDNCRAMFILGDVIYDRGVSSVNDPQFTTKFKEPYKNITMPIYIAYGNHDYLGCIDCYLQFKSTAPLWQMPAKYYKVNFGDFDFFVIDTEKFNAIQQEWLIEELANSGAKYKIILGHKPVKTSESAHANENWDGREALRQIICKNADLYIAGHSHVLEDVGTIDGCTFQQIVSGGGGAETREIINKSTNKNFFYEDNGFVSLEEKDKDLEIKFLDKNGNSLFSREIIR